VSSKIGFIARPLFIVNRTHDVTNVGNHAFHGSDEAALMRSRNGHESRDWLAMLRNYDLRARSLDFVHDFKTASFEFSSADFVL